MNKIYIQNSRRVDCSALNSSGKYDWYYEYDVMEFIDVQHALKLTARSDTKNPFEASFIDFSEHNGYFSQYLLHFALRYLRKMGKTKITYISPHGFAVKPEISCNHLLKQVA